MKLCILLGICGSTILAQGGGRPTLEGVWKATEIVVTGGTPKALFKTAFDSLMASSGTYELNGSTATFRPIVTRGPNIVSINEQFRIEGDTLTLTWTSSDLHLRIGQDVVRSTAPSFQGRMKLVRVE